MSTGVQGRIFRVGFSHIFPRNILLTQEQQKNQLAFPPWTPLGEIIFFNEHDKLVGHTSRRVQNEKNYDFFPLHGGYIGHVRVTGPSSRSTRKSTGPCQHCRRGMLVNLSLFIYYYFLLGNDRNHHVWVSHAHCAHRVKLDGQSHPLLYVLKKHTGSVTREIDVKNYKIGGKITKLAPDVELRVRGTRVYNGSTQATFFQTRFVTFATTYVLINDLIEKVVSDLYSF